MGTLFGHINTNYTYANYNQLYTISSIYDYINRK